MSKVIVDLESSEPIFHNSQIPEKKSIFGKILKILAALVVLTILAGAVGGFFYWRHLKTTPQYSLALIVDAARRDDQKAIDELVDTDEIVEDFVPQIVDKAVELYGRGLAPDVIQRVARLATPILPVVKQRAKAELPDLIREKTAAYEKIPFWAMAIGAGNFLDIDQENDKASLKSKIPDRPFEIKMKRNGDKWQVVAIKDEKLARRVAEKIGQEMIAMAKNRGKDKVTELGRRIGIKNLGELIEKAQDIFK
ncbi:MAG: hypothetical protein HKN25_11380 [Pyrinomonadaceae bacterium]|nr:hypothetical protein [Pyrinomonadaceae bacterium]